jgi:hypothetical protein
MACLYYKDIITGKIRHTFAKPVAVTRDGIANAEGLLLRNRCSEIWIPHYLLVGASLAQFNHLKATQEAQS